jgi:hypothetical protein
VTGVLLLSTVIFGFQGTDAYEIMVGIMILEVFSYIFSCVLAVLITLVAGSFFAIKWFIRKISNIWT